MCVFCVSNLQFVDLQSELARLRFENTALRFAVAALVLAIVAAAMVRIFRAD